MVVIFGNGRSTFRTEQLLAMRTLIASLFDPFLAGWADGSIRFLRRGLVLVIIVAATGANMFIVYQIDLAIGADQIVATWAWSVTDGGVLFATFGAGDHAYQHFFHKNGVDDAGGAALDDINGRFAFRTFRRSRWKRFLTIGAELGEEGVAIGAELCASRQLKIAERTVEVQFHSAIVALFIIFIRFVGAIGAECRTAIGAEAIFNVQRLAATGTFACVWLFIFFTFGSDGARFVGNGRCRPFTS